MLILYRFFSRVSCWLELFKKEKSSFYFKLTDDVEWKLIGKETKTHEVFITVMRLDSQDQFLSGQMENFCILTVWATLSIDKECVLLDHGELGVERSDGVVVLGLLLFARSLVVHCHCRTVAVRSAVVHSFHLVERPDASLQPFRQVFRELNHGLLLVLPRSFEISR